MGTYECVSVDRDLCSTRLCSLYVCDVSRNVPQHNLRQQEHTQKLLLEIKYEYI